jgi:hypothetical protein
MAGSCTVGPTPTDDRVPERAAAVAADGPMAGEEAVQFFLPYSPALGNSCAVASSAAFPVQGIPAP